MTADKPTTTAWAIKAPDLVLHLKYKYFDAIACGTKKEEYRETTPYWRKRIEGKSFGNLILYRGYSSTFLKFPWRGYTIKNIGHWERQEMIEVFAIRCVRVNITEVQE